MNGRCKLFTSSRSLPGTSQVVFTDQKSQFIRIFFPGQELASRRAEFILDSVGTQRLVAHPLRRKDQTQCRRRFCRDWQERRNTKLDRLQRKEKVAL